MEDLYLKLSSSRQLTRYREDWPGDKKGCVFYVPQKMAICLINAPWRKEDTPGQFDVLHGAEVANISEQDILLQGLPALLLAIDNQTSGEHDLTQEIWDLYKQNAPWAGELIPDYDAMAILLREALAWSKRNQSILVKCFGRKTMYQLNRQLCMLFRKELAQIMTNIENVMTRTHSLFRVNFHGQELLCAYRDFRLDAFLWTENKGYITYESFSFDNAFDLKGLAYGFPATYINYRMSHFAIERIMTGDPDMNIMADKILNSFSEFCPSANACTDFTQWYITDINKVPLAEKLPVEFTSDNNAEIYKTYINLFINRYQREVVYRQFFTNQLRYCQYREGVDATFNEVQRKDIWSNAKAFLDCALKHMEGHEGYPMAEEMLKEAYSALDAEAMAVPSDTTKPFKFLTRKCYDENKVQLVESELEAAIAESDPAIWDCLLRNIHLGYIEELDPLKSTQILLAIEARFGKTGRSSRNFNIARTKARFQRLG